MTYHERDGEGAAGELLAYVNGDLVPKSEAMVPVSDAGFKWGYAVFDSLRTFGGEPTFIEDYLDRIERSARAMRIDLPGSKKELRGIITEVIDANLPRLERQDDDLKLPLYISGLVPGREAGGSPSTIVVPSAITFADHAPAFIDGARLVTARTRHLSPETLSPSVKSTARLHLRLADIEVHREDPGAEALLLDLDGNVTELTFANVFVVRDGRLHTPPLRNVLGGITRTTVLRLARELDIPAHEKPFTLYDVYNADEVFYTSSSRTIVPVTEVDGIEIGDGRPGKMTGTLQDAFSELVGLDIVDQYVSRLPGEERPEMLRASGDRDS